MYGLRELPETLPPVPHKPIRIFKPSITKAINSSPVELPAMDTGDSNAANTTNPITPQSATKQELTEPVRSALNPVPSVDLFDLLHVRGFDRQQVGDVDEASSVGTDCVISVRCRDYWIDDAMQGHPAVDVPVTTKMSDDDIPDGLGQTPAGTEATMEEGSPTKTDEDITNSLVIEDENIEEEEDEDEDMATRLGGLA
jgi:hypothetical protein